MNPDIAHRNFDQGHLMRRFGLTPAEARIAAGLASGLSTTEMARRFGIQPNTVRAHLKRVLFKCGASRQTELVAMLWCWLLEQMATVATQAGWTCARAGSCPPDNRGQVPSLLGTAASPADPLSPARWQQSDPRPRDPGRPPV